MNALLERLLWKSPIGQQIRTSALDEVATKEAELRAKLRDLEVERDKRSKDLTAAISALEPEINALRAQKEALENDLRAKHHTWAVQLPGELDAARMRFDMGANTIRKELADLTASRQQLGEAP